ncbi:MULTISPECIES: MCE family protein [Actinokineospora]|uniref:ABC transporter substrate-binding protein n=1 Tax=Actinokineospora fastidiosa TaxID=1816 RepID=A0A918LHF5_9PSEU|nr:MULTISPECIES: MCE family protein [Actinokineospora]UVS78913.1 virulence factor Mce family protein [Actinokineospora sp. UTMC 2448]GGS48132.1 ABC transporter substrate-binding protein [Actinokineospora fastidiosa]
MRRRRSIRRRNQAMGVVFILLLGALGWLTIAVYNKDFVSTDMVTLRADRAGTQLRLNADVKVRGMVVGAVREIRTDGDGVAVELALDPDKAELLPANVTARLLPKTLFGQRYVSLVLPETPEGILDEGDTIRQDTSERAIEIEKALRDLLPVLQAVQPQKLASTLGAVSQALEGRGDQLGETLSLLDDYLAEINPELPKIKEDITKFADTLEVYEEAAPDIVDALAGLTTTSKTLVEQRDQLGKLFATLTTTSDDLDRFLRGNRETLIGLANNSRPTLELLARYSPEFPCLTQAVMALKPDLEKAFGVGTNEPGLHVKLDVKESRGAYRPGADRPRYTAGGGPRCYPGGLAAGATAAVATPASYTEDGLGLPNSPQENAFVGELVAAADGGDPAAVGGFGSLLVGPLLRGAEVELS